MASAGTVVVSGMVCARPHQGGATWAVLQFVLGLRRLGWRTHFVESVEHAGPANVSYLAATMSAFGLDSSWSLLDGEGRTVAGLPRNELVAYASAADLLLNISGCVTDPMLLAGPALRVYVDLDPAFTQLWHETQGIDMGLDRHDRFVTVGLSIGEAECRIPTAGREWVRIAPPVVLEHWPVTGAPPAPEMTSIGNWRGYGSIEHDGVFYGQRAHTMRRLMDLPSLTNQPFLLALAIHPHETKDIEALDAGGWSRVDPQSVAHDPASYRSFVSGSRAEISIPKSGYVVSRSGWFSDRSACYLASGRPVVAMSTGFEHHLPTGDGLLSFNDAREAAGCIAAVNADYAGHCAAAREIAEEHLDSDRVLAGMLDAISRKPAPLC
jgi:hypothetical protein